MPREKEKAKNIYKFCINSHYYETLVQYVNGKNKEVKEEKNCDNIVVDTQLYEDVSTEDVCKEFKYLYKSFGKYHGKEISLNGTFTDYDCNFLNYWLNDKLRKKVNDDSNHIKLFYEKIKEQGKTFYCDDTKMEDYMHVIDPEILQNMKILYELYHTKQKILDIMLKEDISSSEMSKCPEYIGICQEKYREGLDKCHSVYDDFYKALKLFKMDYKYGIEKETDKSGCCNISDNFRLPEYDPVPEKEKEKRIMTIKISSILSVLSLALPLIYKFTPFGPFLRGKINMVRNRWFNPDENGEELLSLSTDIEDNISDNEEYNIGYYSETN
ncbi:PIR Superfamily Protein [Plasmodium ovale wallikeri]|uniref:PIR Superfamily Protein n=1 Tax=Plasmodium ovale wallikeri TaxID=864142 RepID=A0A1A9APF7_PLAOA|nr:PIR Superfamily Protein [Plasmodium ovale wallikeri]